MVEIDGQDIIWSLIDGRKTLESSGTRPSSSDAHQKMVEIDGQDIIWSVAFLVDGRHVVGGGLESKIRRWRVDDGVEEEGTPMDAGEWVCDIAVSQDGKWIVCGTWTGEVRVWNAETHERVTKFTAHSNRVRAVDVSSDSTKIATGSNSGIACVWSLSTGEQLLDLLEHGQYVSAVKFSPHRHLIATGSNDSVRIYDSQDGCLFVDVPIGVISSSSQSLAWSSNGVQLFVLSSDDHIHCLDTSTGTTLSQWPVHGNDSMCIALASNDAFIAAAFRSSISFWDTTTYNQIGSIQHTADIGCMAISANYELVISSDEKISLCNLSNILPSSYCTLVDAIQQLRDHLMDSERLVKEKDESLNNLRDQLATCQRAANEKEASLIETISTLCARDENSSTSNGTLTRSE